MLYEWCGYRRDKAPEIHVVRGCDTGPPSQVPGDCQVEGACDIGPELQSPACMDGRKELWCAWIWGWGGGDHDVSNDEHFQSWQYGGRT
jgi:hypothetical protein